MDTSYNIGNEMDANMFNQYMYKVVYKKRLIYFVRKDHKYKSRNCSYFSPFYLLTLQQLNTLNCVFSYNNTKIFSPLE